MPEKIFVIKKDSNRILHTEVLPFEMPIHFSNIKLYRFLKSKHYETAPQLFKNLLAENNDYTIPYDYEIRRGVDKKRTLSLIHPAVQIEFVNFYKNYFDQILSLCSKSSYSLRYPSKVSSHFYNKDYGSEEDSLKTLAADQEPEAFEEENKHSSTFFYYARYSQLYRFIESSEFLELESRFSNLMKFDIKSCFPSIYTHTISWAIKGKSFAKANKQSFSFDAAFDNLMAKANYQETHGIVVGPEFSRIFAEIILQQIDLNIANELKKENISINDFAIRRYVDDYFIFSRDSKLNEKILKIAENALKEYKLFINEAKTENHVIPFATPQTIAKTDIQKVLQDSILLWLNYLKKICKEDASGVNLEKNHSLQLITPYKLSVELIRDIRIAVKRGEVSFSVITNYALGSITKSLYRLYKAKSETPIPKAKQLEFQNILLLTIEVVFFLFSMDFRVRTSYFISQLMIIVSRLTESDRPFNEYIVSNMRNHIEKQLNKLPKDQNLDIEVINLLITLKKICPNELFSQDKLLDLCVSKYDPNKELTPNTLAHLTYFDFSALLYYIDNSSEYANLRKALVGAIFNKLSSPTNISRNSELTYLFLDMISCPFISNAEKKNITKIVFLNILKRNPTNPEINQIINYGNKRISFIDWKLKNGLEKLLMKKQLNPAY